MDSYNPKDLSNEARKIIATYRVPLDIILYFKAVSFFATAAKFVDWIYSQIYENNRYFHHFLLKFLSMI